MRLDRDLVPLLRWQGLLLLVTLAFGGGNLADVRVQFAWLAFLLPGWWLAPTVVGNHATVLTRYVVGMVVGVAAHGILASIASWFDVSLTHYLFVWGILFLASMVVRQRSIGASVDARTPLAHELAIATLMLFCVAVYRTPISNDIGQFILQQQDMLASDSMRASAIGMEAFGVDQPMPRWRAQLWHVLPCVLAKASGVAVDQVLYRYATIPVAFSTLFSLLHVTRYFSRRRASVSLVMFALLGPVLLYYRNFCVFNYSFRVSNNLLLDKDFALFFLVPAVLFCAARWMDGKARYAVLGGLLVPAILRFHPLTPVYLILGLPALFLLRMPPDRVGVSKAAAIAAFACAPRTTSCA
ncbi:MAG: hypothetical protein AAFX06_29530, partial [Planctomycetota bacterium]